MQVVTTTTHWGVIQATNPEDATLPPNLQSHLALLPRYASLTTKALSLSHQTRSLPGPAPAVPLPPFPVTPMVLLLTRLCMILPYPAQVPTKKSKIWLLHTNPDPLQ